MAARKLKPLHSDEIRAKIQTSQLINRLTDHALGKIELSSTQVRAIEVLIKKTVPDLSAVQLQGTGEDGEHVHKVVREIVRPENTDR